MGKSKRSNCKTKYERNYQVTHQKGQIFSILLQPKVQIELEKLLNQGHPEKLSFSSDQNNISPIVISGRKGSIYENSFKIEDSESICS